jgi:hypothetical protein
MNRSISGPERYNPIGGAESPADPPLTASTIALRTIGENGVCKIRTHYVAPRFRSMAAKHTVHGGYRVATESFEYSRRNDRRPVNVDK